MSRPVAPLVALTVTCLAAGFAYSGAVTSFALGAFVLPGIVLAASLTALTARLSPWAGVVAGATTALAWAELVNLLSGNTNGPAARSTFAAALFTAVAIAAASGPAPAGFLFGVVGVLAGALALGAGSEVGAVAIVTVVLAVVALGFVQRAREGWVDRPPSILVAVPVCALLVGATVSAVLLIADLAITTDPAVMSKAAVDPSIQAPGLLGVPAASPTSSSTSTPTASADQEALPSAEEPPASSPAARFLVALLALALLAVLSVTLRALWVALAWRGLRRRLRRGSPDEQVSGAWVWARRRIEAAGLELPTSVPVDLVSRGAGTSALPRPLRRPLVQLARTTEAATFAPGLGPDRPDGEAAWLAADRVAQEAVRSLGAGRRVALALRPIRSRPSRPPGLSDDLVEMR